MFVINAWYMWKKKILLEKPIYNQLLPLTNTIRILAHKIDNNKE